ncbi:MAG: hypothetical protein K2X50_00380 [Gammaproteobacteria bacterium]|nr:hypothetical protein [Gammaproteobacteria bacterium]
MTKDYTLQLDESFKGSLCEETLNQLIQISIASIGPEVTWDHFEAYLASKIPAEDALFDNLDALIFSAFQESETSKESLDNGLCQLTFTDSQTAQAFFAFTQHTFPIINSEFPKINNNEILLTDDQLFFCRLRAKLHCGDLPSDTLTDYFLKTLRADIDDYSDKFIKGIIPTPEGTRRLQNLRPIERHNFTILGDGSVRSREAHAILEKPDHKNFTQNQSCTYLGADALTPAFGFDKSREAKLYGILTHRNDLKINRLLINDGGTIARPFDATSKVAAEYKAKSLKSNNNIKLYAPQEFTSFISENAKIRKHQNNTNEVLARLRFNVFRAMICICADNLEARLLANDFAEEILEAFSDYARSNGIKLNPKFKLRVIFYTQNPKCNEHNNEPQHRIHLYTRLMRFHDRKTATQIYDSRVSRTELISSNNFEFLLGLENITAKMLTDSTSRLDRTPLAINMMQCGHVRMLLRLIRPSRQTHGQVPHEQSTLSTTVFDTLIKKNRSLLNNHILVSYLIRAEAFDVATKIINSTNLQLVLFPAVQHFGAVNPRHLNYFGLEKNLRLAAELGHWVIVRLCLKEYLNISQETVDYLFILACNNKRGSSTPDIVFLLKKRKVSLKTIKLALKNTLDKSDFKLSEIILTYHENLKCSQDNSDTTIVREITQDFGSIGIEKKVKSAADYGHWTTVRFFLKEYSGITQETLDHLLIAACDKKDSANDTDIIFLLKQKKVSIVAIQKVLERALQKADHELLELIIKNFETYFLLLAALKIAESKPALLILRIGIHTHPRPALSLPYALTSTLLYGIRYGFNDLLSQLVEYENKYPDQYTEARYWLAVDLARVRDNNSALDILHVDYKNPTQIDPYNIKLSSCYRVFEALFANQPEVAQFRLSTSASLTTVAALEAYSDEFETALLLFNDFVSEHNDSYINAFFGSLLDLCLPDYNISTVRHLQQLFFKNLNITESKTEQLIIKLALSKLSESNISSIRALVLSSNYIGYWKRELIKNFFYPKYVSYKATDILFTIIIDIKENDLYSELVDYGDTDDENITRYLENRLDRVLFAKKWDLAQLYLSEIEKIDSEMFHGVLLLAGEQSVEIERATFLRFKKLYSRNINDFVNERVVKAAETKNWSGVRFYLSESDEIYLETIKTLLSVGIEPSLRDELRLHWKPRAFSKAINHELWCAVREKPPKWDTISSYLSSIQNPENYSQFGCALLLAMRDREIGLARKLFPVVKSDKWREIGHEYQLLSTIFYVVKYQLKDLMEVSYQHEIISYHDNSKRRLRLALDLAKLLKHKSAIDYLEPKVAQNPLLDLTDPLKSVCLLVFEAYFIGERALAEWRLFHYGHQFGFIAPGCTNITEGLTILLSAYERALPYLPYSSENEPFKCIENVFLYYGNATPCIIMREKSFSTIKVCSCCAERNIAGTLILATPLEKRQALMAFIKNSNHLDRWLDTLTSKEVFSALRESRKNNELDLMIGLLEIVLFVLEQINQNKARYLSNVINPDSTSRSVEAVIELYESQQFERSSSFNFFSSTKLKEISKLYQQVKDIHQLIIQPEPDNTQLHDKSVEPDTDVSGAHKTL